MLPPNQSPTRFLPFSRWFLLILSVLLPLLLLSTILVGAQGPDVENVISGVVVNPDGSALTGTTTVYMWHPNWDDEYPANADGTFEFTATVPAGIAGDLFHLQAEEPWYSEYFSSVPEPFYLNNVGATDAPTLTLTYASFTGTVYLPGGVTPSPEGYVAVIDMMPPDRPHIATGDIDPGGSGYYAVGGVPEGVFDLVAFPPKDSLFWQSLPTPVTVITDSQYFPGNTQAISLTLQNTNVQGEVVYPDGSPAGWIISGTETTGEAVVETYNPMTSESVERPTAAGGQFGLLLPDGAYDVWAYPTGEMAYTYTKSLPQAVPVYTGTAMFPTDPLTLTFPGIEGEVLNPDGSVITGCVDVWLDDQFGNWVDSFWFCNDVISPTFRFGGLRDGVYWLKTDGLPEADLFPGPPIEVTIDPDSQYVPTATQWLEPMLTGPQLEVFVDNPNGDPIAAQVTLWRDEPWFEATANSYDNGPALFGGIEPGGYWITAHPMNYDIPALANSEKHYISVGPNWMSYTLQLRYPTVVGVVETPEGDPLRAAQQPEGPPAEINVHNSDWSIDLWATTNITGEFGLALPHGDYVLLAEPKGQNAYTYTKSMPDHFTLDNASPYPEDRGFIRLTYPRIQGFVVDAVTGEILDAGVDVWQTVGGDYQEYGETHAPRPPYDPPHPFRFGGLPDGEFLMEGNPFDQSYGVSNVYGIMVTPGSQYTLTATEQITLTVERVFINVFGEYLFPPDDPDCPNCPVPWAGIRLIGNDGYEDWTASDEGGKFAFGGLVSGTTYLIEADVPQELKWQGYGHPAPFNFTLNAPDEVVSATLRLGPPIPPPNTIFGVVEDGDGSLVDDAIVKALNHNTGVILERHTSLTGTYRIGVNDGDWQLWVEPDNPYPGWYFDPADEVWIGLPITNTPAVEVNFPVHRFGGGGEEIKVTGVVTTPNSAPVPGNAVWVELCRPGAGCFGDEVGPDGQFTIWTFPGDYDFFIHTDPDSGLFPPLDNPIPVFVDPANRDLGAHYLRALGDRTATIEGRVRDFAGQGVNDVRMEVWTDEGDWNATNTATSTLGVTGVYSLPVFPGRYHVYPVLTPEQEDVYVVLPPAMKEGFIADGQTAGNVNFVLRKRDAVIRGQIVDAITKTTVLTDVLAIVIANQCDDTGNCLRTIAETEALLGNFELKVVGGLTYTLDVWLPEGGYMVESLPAPMHVTSASPVTNAQISLIEAGTRIYGKLVEGIDDVKLKAQVFGSDGNYWVDDVLSPDRDPYVYNLYVPTPVTEAVTWTLGLRVNPADGYIPDPAHPVNLVRIEPGVTEVSQILYVKKLDFYITGTVKAGGNEAPYVWVYAEGFADAGPGRQPAPGEELYFEAQADASGVFTIPVLPGQYEVSAYLPPNLQDGFVPPQPVLWTSVDDNPIELVFLPKPAADVEISGGLSFADSQGTVILPDATEVAVFGWNDDGYFIAVTGTVASGYTMPVFSNTTWYLWAIYEDVANGAFYEVETELEVVVGSVNVAGQNLLLMKSQWELPPSECWSFDPTKSKRLSLPYDGSALPPQIDILAGTMPVTGTVQVCATPRLALPGGNNIVGFAYSLEARNSSGTLITRNFNKNARFSWYIPGDLSPEDAAILELAFYSTTRDEWVALTDAYISAADGYATGSANHFSDWAMVIPPQISASGGKSAIYLPIILK